jgi:hypothetical protein
VAGAGVAGASGGTLLAANTGTKPVMSSADATIA